MRRLGLLLCLVMACGEVTAPAPDARLPMLEGAALELMYFTLGPDGITRFGGLAGAIEDPSLGFRFRTSSGLVVPLSPDASGAFEAELGEDAESSGTLERGEESLRGFERRSAAEACRVAVWPSVGGAGSVPNDLVFAGVGEQARLVLVRSGDHAVSIFDRELGLETELGLRLPERSSTSGPVGAQPWFAAPLDDGERVAVTAFLQDTTYLIHLPTLRIEAELQADGRLRLESPLTLPYAIDLEGDGTVVTEIDAFRPRRPQGVLAVGDQIFVAYSGFVAPRLGPSRAPVYLPGVLARFSVRAPEGPPRLLILPLHNPQSIGFDAARGHLLVTASGVLDANPQVRAVSEGGVIVIEPREMSVVETHLLGDFAPGSALVMAGGIWVASLSRPEVLRVSIDGEPSERFRLNDEEVDSIFRLIELPGGLIGAPSFNTDRLHLIDAGRRQLNPAPFFAPLEVGPGRPIFDGLQIVARRPGRLGVDFVGPDLFALSGLASRVVPIELRKVLGP